MEVLDNKRKWFEGFFISILTLVVAYMLLHPTLHNTMITRMIWMPAMALIVVSWFLSDARTEFGLKNSMAVILLVIIFVIGLAGATDPFESERLFACVMFFVFIISLRIYSGIKISKTLFDFIYYVAVALSILFFLYSFTGIAHQAYLDGEFTVNRYLVFNLDNSNVAGIYIYCLLGVLLINLRKRKFKIINIVLILIDLYLIYGTNSRASLVAAIVVLVLALLPIIRRMPSVFVIIAWILPIIFVFIYMYLYESGYEDIEILNKALFSGREVVYQKYIEKIDGPMQVLFGNLADSKLQNAHNAPLSYYTSIGLVGAIISEIMILSNIFRINKPTKNSFVSVAVMLGLLVHSSFESGMFLGGYPGIVFVLLFFLLANYEEDCDEDGEEE